MSETASNEKQGRGGARKGAGRKSILFDEKLLTTIKELAGIGCTMEEIEKVTHIDRTTFYKQEGKKREAIFAAIEAGRDEMKVSLRRQQMKQALDGNSTMLVWLGKQILGQRDKTDVKAEVAGANGGPIQFESPLSRLSGAIEGIAARLGAAGQAGEGGA